MSSDAPLVVLVGNPNTGKTALFNSLTGSRQKVANYPGVTVEKKEGWVTTPKGKNLRLLDLPGAYSLEPHSPDEAITRDALIGRLPGEKIPQLCLVIVDSTNLERNLAFVLEMKSVGIPTIVVLNMMDLAASLGLSINVAKLSQKLGLPVIPSIATKKEGLINLSKGLDDFFSEDRKATSSSSWKVSSQEEIESRFQLVDQILSDVLIVSSHQHSKRMWSDRIDHIVLHPLWGSLTLLLFLGLIFQAIFSWASVPMDLIEKFLEILGVTFSKFIPQGELQSLIVDGVISGVGSVLVFLPQILLLFFFIFFLEDSGYMARAAFLMDRIMGKVGLNGRAFVPLLSSHACAIPGIMATRTIDNPRDRLVTILIAPLTTCSARLPVYALLIGAFIPSKTVLGFLNLQGLVLFGLYFTGIFSALVIGFIFKHTFLKGPKPILMMELPTYKTPSLKSISLNLLERAKVFLKRAGTLILGISIILWFLTSYPKPPADAQLPDINYSFAGRLGHAIEPMFRPIGFDWKITTGLIPGLAAREVMVSALATVYAVEEGDETDQVLGQKLSQEWSLATALSLLVWYIFAPQCLATLAVVRRETQSLKWPIVMFGYMFALAYLASFITYRIAIYLS